MCGGRGAVSVRYVPVLFFSSVSVVVGESRGVWPGGVSSIYLAFTASPCSRGVYHMLYHVQACACAYRRHPSMYVIMLATGVP